VAPQPLENALRLRTRLVNQVVVFGDRRPYCVALVTLSEEARTRFGGDSTALAASSEVRAALEKEIDALNATLASYETIKRFAVLPADFTEAAGELTPSLKVRRKVVAEHHRDLIEALYRT
jgi:long-chain acyl-CoA synthetase